MANGSVEQGKPPHPTSFTRASVNVHKTEDVLIRLEGKPVLIGVRDQYGRYKVPLVRRKGKSLPRVPTSSEVTHLEQAQNVYDLPSVEETILTVATCLLWFPCQTHVVNDNQEGQLHRMAITHCQASQQIFS